MISLQETNTMKQSFLVTMALLLTAGTLFAQKMGNENRKSPHETIKGGHISITYGRPYKNGRQIFGGLVPYGQVWRTGADEATEITIDKNCTFAGKPLKAGTYTLFTIPNPDGWTVILNSELKQWGAFGYDKVKGKDVLTASVTAAHVSKVTEQFTITISNPGNNMVGTDTSVLLLDWDQTEVSVPIKF
jgi:hypothetical protein